MKFIIIIALQLYAGHLRYPAEDIENFVLEDLCCHTMSSGTIQNGTVFLRLGDQVSFSTQERDPAVRWYSIEPEQKEYDQFNFWKISGMGPMGLSYRIKETGGYEKNYCIRPEQCGTFYVCKGRVPVSLRFTESQPLQIKYTRRIVQVSVRKDDTYMGILSELFGTPFILPPCQVGGSHQTDLRMGSDCAEFVIYGMRRMGRNIPYAGPQGIRQFIKIITSGCIPDRQGRYLDSTGKPVPIGDMGVQYGDILHFGGQVSLFIEDHGIPGFLDKDDLLLQCYGFGPHTVGIEHSSFYQYTLDICRWKQ